MTGAHGRVSIDSVASFVLAHLLLVAVLAAPIIIGKRHAAQHRERELERRRVRCPDCGAVVGELKTCAPQEHALDLRTIGH